MVYRKYIIVIIVMALLIPPEYKDDMSMRSGFLKHGSRFAGKNLKGLFMAPENQRYLGRQLYTLTTLPQRIVEVLNIGLSKSDYLDARSQYGMRGDEQKSGGRSGTFVDGTFAPADNYAPEAMRMSQELRKYKVQIEDIIPSLIFDYGSKFYTNDFYEEDYSTSSPVQQLHHLNKKFLLESSQNIIQSPGSVIAGYYDIDPDTGKTDLGEADFSARSYADGTWHPEDLFTNTARNRATSYWVPREISFDSHPPRSRMRDMKKQGFDPFSQNRAIHKQHRGLMVTKREGYEAFENGESDDSNNIIPDLPLGGPYVPEYPGNGYGDVLTGGNMDRGDYGVAPQEFTQDPLLDDPMYGPGPGAGNRYMYDFYGEDGFSKGGLFPAWQYTPNIREYDRHVSEGLREGGSSDRRVNSARRTGYDMSALISKSTY